MKFINFYSHSIVTINGISVYSVSLDLVTKKEKKSAICRTAKIMFDCGMSRQAKLILVSYLFYLFFLRNHFLFYL